MSKNQEFDLLKPVTTSPQRPRHQLRRSITELSSPIKLPRHHHHHHHLHHHHHHQRKDRDNDDQTPFPASHMLQLPRGSFELSRSEATTPYATSETGFKINMLNPTSDDATHSIGSTAPQQTPMNQEEMLREQKEKAASTITGLRKSLVELSSYSTTTTIRLDDTYYSVLEKLSVLQSRIIALKELASMSQGLDQNFRAESRGLVSELEQQADSFGHFGDQQKRIEELQGRIHAGRDKVEALSKRVDKVRERIENWARADREWREKTRKRLKIIWIITSVLIFSLILILFGAQYASSNGDTPAAEDLASSSGQGGPDMNNLSGNQSMRVAAMVDEVREALESRKGDEPAGDAVFRALDEL